MPFNLIFEYKDLNKVLRVIKENNAEIITQKMNLNCDYLISIRRNNASKLKMDFENLRCLKIKKM